MNRENKGNRKFGKRESAVSRPLFLARLLSKLKLLGLLPKVDGWRSATQAYLRTEHTKFVLTAFRLDLWSDACSGEPKTLASAKKHLIERLAAFLKGHPLTHSQLLWGRFSTLTKKKDPVDMVCADFNEDGSLKSLWPWLEQDGRCFKFIDDGIAARLTDLLIKAYNQLISIKDDQRPSRLSSELKKRVRGLAPQAKEETAEFLSYLGRILNSVWIHFEVLPHLPENLGPSRYQYPDFILCKHPGLGVMNIRCRLTEDFTEADLWFQISHVVIDGVPMQDILNALKAQWKTRGDLVFPPAAVESAENIPVRCTTESGANARYYADQRIDFRPLLKARDTLNQVYAGKLESPVTVISMLGWGLAQHPAFLGTKFLFPVDLPSVLPGERTLGFVSIRPSRYLKNPRYQDAFLAYQHEFNRKLSRARARINGIYRLFELGAYLPPVLYWFLRKYMKGLLSQILGTVVITVIREADFFIAPFSDVILDGFIAIGNYSIPTEDNAMVGLVSAKSTKDKVTQYLAAVKQVATNFKSV